MGESHLNLSVAGFNQSHHRVIRLLKNYFMHKIKSIVENYCLSTFISWNVTMYPCVIVRKDRCPHCIGDMTLGETGGFTMLVS